MIQQDEDDIIFEPISSDPVFNGNSNPSKQPVEGSYPSLYAEIIDKCEPTKFLDPYDERKASLANELYASALSNRNNIDILKRLRIRAINELGVKFSTKGLYTELMDICNPRRFSGENYNQNYFEKSNRLYSKIQNNADDIVCLEQIQAEASDLYHIIQSRQREETEQEQIEQIRNDLLCKSDSWMNGFWLCNIIVTFCLLVYIFTPSLSALFIILILIITNCFIYKVYIKNKQKLKEFEQEHKLS